MFETKGVDGPVASAQPRSSGSVLLNVLTERSAQIEKWGPQAEVGHDRWFTIMLEELGEAARASLHERVELDQPRPIEGSYDELVQLAAILLRALEVW